MTSKVYFADMRTGSKRNLAGKVVRLFRAAGFSDLIVPGDFVALKLHIGQPGNLAFIPPPLVRQVVDLVYECGGKPFLTDCNTLYSGPRSNAIEHTIAAIEHGFSYATVKAPFIVADGLTGRESVVVSIDGVRLREARIGAAIARADAMIVLSHFKGHEVSGFGGAIKNLGMGCASRAGKQIQHSSIKPKVEPSKCKGDQICIRACPVQAITLQRDRKAYIDETTCIGCAECTILCPHEAISIQWSEGDKNSMQERMAEYALGAIQGKVGKVGFFNFLMQVGPLCDCYRFNDAAIVPDLGILASNDPVAIDQASVDLVNAAPGITSSRLGNNANSNDKFGVLWPDHDWRVQLAHGERIGLGSRQYELIPVEK